MKRFASQAIFDKKVCATFNPPASDLHGSEAALHGFSATDRPGGTILVISERSSARPAVEC
jgi:hypothetical protein